MQLVSLLAVALLAACSSPADDPPACPAELVDAASPDGISAKLTWTPAYENVDGTPASVPVGFRILYGTAPDRLSCSLAVRDGTAKSAALAGLPPGEWHFAVVQIASETVESVPSAAVSKRIQ